MNIYIWSFFQYIVESARQRPAKRRIVSGGRKSLYQKLYELYLEECEKEPELKVGCFYVWVGYGDQVTFSSNPDCFKMLTLC